MADSGAAKASEAKSTGQFQLVRALLLAATALSAIAVAAVLGIWWKSNQPESWLQRGRAAIEAGDPETAKQLAESLMKTHGLESQGRLLRGLLLIRSGAFSDALKQLEPASRDSRTLVEASSAAARCFYALGRFLETIDASHAALEKDPKCLDARRWLAAAYYDLGAISHAFIELEKLSEQAPTDPRPDRLLGLISKDGEQFEVAIKHYAESLRRNPTQSDRELILLEMTESQIGLSQFEEGLITLRQSKRSAASLILESTCHRGLGHADLAIERIQSALELDPRNYRAKLVYGKLLVDVGDVQRAARVFQDAVDIEPQNSKGHLELSQSMRQLGRVDEADLELKKMIEIQGLERRFSDLHDEAAKQPADAQVRFEIGALARQLDKPQLARMWFRAALGLNPNHSGALSALRELEGSPARNDIQIQSQP